MQETRGESDLISTTSAFNQTTTRTKPKKQPTPKQLKLQYKLELESENGIH